MVVVLALVCAFWCWGRQPWLKQWIRGSCGFVFVAVATVGIFLIVDLASYKILLREKPITTVSVYEIGKQEYDVTLVDEEGKERRFIIFGDQWQLDVRLLLWKTPWSLLGVDSLYRLDRISGRYLSLEQERNGERSVYALETSKGLDFWQIVGDKAIGVDAHYGSAVYLPLVNGAVFAVYKTAKGLIARPVNEVAESAVNGNW